MSVVHFTCDACGARLAAPAERAGRKGKCKHCGGAVTVPSPETDEDDAPKDVTPSARRPRSAAGRRRPARDAAPPETREDDAPEADEDDRSRRPASARSGWRRVSLGLMVLLVTTAAGILIGLFAWLGGFVFSFSGVSADPARDLSNMLRLLVAGLVVGRAREIAVLTGYALCCFLPRRCGGRGLVVAAFALGAVALVVNTAGDLMGWNVMRTSLQEASQLTWQPPEDFGRGDPQKAMREVQEQAEKSMKHLESMMKYLRWSRFQAQLALLLSAAQSLAFGYFLLGVARSLGATGTAGNCLNFIKLTAGLLVLQVFSQFCFGVGTTVLSFARLLSVFGVVMQLLALAQAGWFLLVLYEVRNLVNEQGHKRSRRKP